MSRELVWVPGGTDPDAVGALYAELTARLGRPQPGWPVLVLAASREQFEDCVGRIVKPLDSVDVVIRTSGSTDGRGRLVGLSLDALLASARATLVRLGGPGRWLTSLPIEAVGGFQVVLRSAVAGLHPAVYTGGGFDPDRFARAVALLDGAPRRYLSFVPTQLHRALDAAPAVLAGFDAILVGGAALAPELAARAAASGVRVVTTYGSTETAGGCVYDGVPLDGVRVRLAEDGRIHLGGPTLATRYLDAAPAELVEADPSASSEIGEWLVTNDLGEWVDGRQRVLGRADDVVISGGVNVHPVAVEAALATLGGQWLVVGVPDEEWGQRVVAVTDLPGGRWTTPGEPRRGWCPLRVRRLWWSWRRCPCGRPGNRTDARPLAFCSPTSSSGSLRSWREVRLCCAGERPPLVTDFRFLGSSAKGLTSLVSDRGLGWKHSPPGSGINVDSKGWCQQCSLLTRIRVFACRPTSGRRITSSGRTSRSTRSRRASCSGSRPSVLRLNSTFLRDSSC